MLQFRSVKREVAALEPLGAVMLVGDYGGFTYIIRLASDVMADDKVLRQLAIDLDVAFGLVYHESTAVNWGISNPWTEWDGGPPVFPGFWMHPRLITHGIMPSAVEAVLSGAVDRLIHTR